jgi:peptide methionine sulfoxide reductase MsrB
VFDDGPAPFFKRIQVNSASLNFKEKPDFELNEVTRERMLEIRKEQKRTKAV